MTINDLPSVDELSDIYVLEGIKGFGPQKFKELHAARRFSSDLLMAPGDFERFGKRGLDFKRQLEEQGTEGRRAAFERATKQLAAAKLNNGLLLTYDNPLYPKNLFESNMPVPVLYVRGDASVLRGTQSVACVGSRKIRPPYSELHEAFATFAVEAGFTIVSGFATGADIIGHLAARRAGGHTICVMPSGLDRPFPPEHKDIWRQFLTATGAVFVSEFGFGVGANTLNLRKRNKMITGMARGVLVSQSSEEGGAMNAYRFAMEQKRPVATFQTDGTADTSGNDLIAGSSSKTRVSILDHSIAGWTAWLQSL